MNINSIPKILVFNPDNIFSLRKAENKKLVRKNIMKKILTELIITLQLNLILPIFT